MGGTSGWFEVIVLAAIAGFIAWRLFSVLGSRTGHEAPPVERRPLGEDARDVFTPSQPAPLRPVYAAEPKAFALPESMSADLQEALREIARLDTRFDPESFLSGARSAYDLILGLFWQADINGLKPLLGDDAHFAFAQAIHGRHMIDTITPAMVQSIESAEITAAEVVGSTAHVTVRFVAKIMTAGDLDTATDDWTFSRHTRSDDPNWLLISTDDSIGA